MNDPEGLDPNVPPYGGFPAENMHPMAELPPALYLPEFFAPHLIEKLDQRFQWSDKSFSGFLGYKKDHADILYYLGVTAVGTSYAEINLDEIFSIVTRYGVEFNIPQEGITVQGCEIEIKCKDDTMTTLPFMAIGEFVNTPEGRVLSEPTDLDYHNAFKAAQEAFRFCLQAAGDFLY